jgi:predicted RNase H-like HicB family nuclease
VSKSAQYPAEVFYSDDDEGYIAVARDLPGCSAFGETPAEAVTELQSAIEAWIGAAQEAGNPVPPPTKRQNDELPSGRTLLRLPRTLHAMLNEASEREGVSFNAHVVSLLSASVAANCLQHVVNQAVSNLVMGMATANFTTQTDPLNRWAAGGSTTHLIPLHRIGHMDVKHINVGWSEKEGQTELPSVVAGIHFRGVTRHG